MSYVPKHLEYNRRQNDGWPEGITAEGKEWATQRIKTLLDDHRYVPLWLAVQAIFEASDRPDDFKVGPGFDFRDATADRALRAADGSMVWVDERWHARRRFRFIGAGSITYPLDAEQAKKHLTKVQPGLDLRHREEFNHWVNRAQIGDIFLLPSPTDPISVFCSDQAQKPFTL